MPNFKTQSRNVWIKEDNNVNSLGVNILAKYKDIYEDILDERRHSSDFKYSLKTKQDVPKYKFNEERTSNKIKNDVLTSARVVYVIEMLSKESKKSKIDIQNDAEAIIDEMAHNFNINSIRFFAFFLLKVFKAIFRRIYVNSDGIQMVRKLLTEYPVLFMPTHRSYFDFLLVSFVCYEYDLPLPAIAAAMDFSSMKFFGWLLRQCGAFYIRRSFGGDRLYWAIFTEYVQTHIRNGDRPLEFFVEGTRSRTGKSYVPKSGMLSAALESYFKAEISDLMIIPINISYEKILEESLYAFELLGIPKPKESTSGLFKASDVLKTDHGTVHFHIASAISIRQFSSRFNLDRIYHSLEPRYINNLSDKEIKLTKYLANDIVLEQQKMAVLSPWSLISTILTQAKGGMVHLNELCREVEWFKRQLTNLRVYIDWPANVPIENIIRHYSKLHSNIVRVKDDGIFEIVLQKPSQKHKNKLVLDDVFLNAATNIMLSSYRNQLIHSVVRISMVCLLINSSQSYSLKLEDIYKQYSFLEDILRFDFVFANGHTKNDLENAIIWLRHVGALSEPDENGNFKVKLNKHLTFFSTILEPFLLCYWLLTQHLLSLPVDAHGRALAKKHKEIVLDAQHLTLKLLQDSIVKYYEILNLDMISNGLHSLSNLNAMYKDKRFDETYLSPNHQTLSNLANKITTFIEAPSSGQISNYVTKQPTSILSSKI